MKYYIRPGSGESQWWIFKFKSTSKGNISPQRWALRNPVQMVNSKMILSYNGRPFPFDKKVISSDYIIDGEAALIKQIFQRGFFE